MEKNETIDLMHSYMHPQMNKNDQLLCILFMHFHLAKDKFSYIVFMHISRR